MGKLSPGRWHWVHRRDGKYAVFDDTGRLYHVYPNVELARLAIKNRACPAPREGGRGKRNTPVICVETGQVWNSISDCARYIERSATALARALDEGTRCAGHHFERMQSER